MSHIAAALAKSKGKKVEAPPPGTPVAPALPPPVLPMALRAPASATAAAAPKKFSLPLVLGGGLALVAVAAAGWFLLKPAAGPAEKPAVIAAKPVIPASVVKPPVSPPVATAPVTAPPARPAAVTPAPVAGSPDAALQEQVAKFSVTLRKGGSDQRAVINGKTYVPGDRVADVLTLQQVLGDRIILRDDSGNLYSK
ncbi:MAG: hypothetical protein WCL04_04905 [Verrucomicrobiota bacterium]